jgi:hypothetical protein
MLACLPDVYAGYRLDLLDQFQNATPEQLNQILSELTQEDAVCGPPGSSPQGGCNDDTSDH